MKLYRHPPRTRQIKLAENLHSLTINKVWEHNQPLYEPSTLGWNLKDGYLSTLISEVIQNGYKYDLCLKCKKDDECMHDVYDEKNKYSILTIV